MRLPRTLRWRIAAAYTALIFVSMGAVSIYLTDFVSDSYQESIDLRVRQEAALVREAVAPLIAGDPSGLTEAAERMGEITNARVTIIAVDGSVLADTHEDPGAMANLQNRQEISQALATGLGRAVRNSPPDGEELRLTAVPIDLDGNTIGIVRLGVSGAGVQRYLNWIIVVMALAFLITGVLAIGLGVWLGGRFTRSIQAMVDGARRLAQGDLDHRVRVQANDETSQLAESFNSMSGALSALINDLRGDHNRLSALLDTMADAVVVVDRNGSISLVNSSARELLALPDTAGGPLRDHDVRRVANLSREANERRQAEVQLRDGRHYVNVIATPLAADTGSLLLTIHDLTGIRQLDITRREFVSNVSHELRTPLASVKAMIETLEQGALNDRDAAVNFLGRIHLETDRMTVLVNDLLTLSRIESGQEELRLVPTEAPSLLEEVKASLTTKATEVGVNVSVEASPDLPSMEVDEDQMRRALVNLLDNALKFTPPGGKVIMRAWLKDGSLGLTVEDTGPGIEAEHLPHVFERFYKAERSRGDRGTGLGLAIAKHIVEAHGGQISAWSRLGEGTAFTIALPLSE